MADVTVIFPQGPITSTTSATVTGGQELEVTGDNTVGPAADGSLKAVGQAQHDAASGARVTLHSRGPVKEAVASGAVAAGERLKAFTGGKVKKYVDGTDAATLVIGVALAGAADGATVRYMGL